MLLFMIAMVGAIATALALDAAPAHRWPVNIGLFVILTTLVATWAIGRRADRDTQHRLTLVLVAFLIVLALSGAKIVRALQ